MLSEEYRNAQKPQAANVPEELRRRPAWMGSRVRRLPSGKLDKPPYRVRAGLPVIKASYTDPANHATFQEARDALERGDVNAIGFVLTEADSFFVLDHDGVIDLDTGEIEPAAVRIVHAVCSYTERSISGTGLHTIALGQKPERAGCKSNALGYDLELYDRRRFVLMTADHFGDTPPELRDGQQALDELCRELWPSALGRAASTPREPVDLDDLELLERARKAKTGAKFRTLYDRGEIDGYPSASEADMGLINMLIFWTAGDRDRVISLFERSALYREPPEKDRGYVARTVDRALSSYVGNFYRPRSRNRIEQEEPEQPDPLEPYLPLLLDPSLWRGKRGASAYKAYAGAVVIATEHGVFDDAGNLRIGCDVRRLAEAAGMSLSTLRESALPYLIQQLRLARWRPGKGSQAGSIVLLNPETVPTRYTKESTHFSVPSQHTPDRVVETLGLLIRMRAGRSKHKPLARLGMVAMFALVALSAAHPRGQTLDQLAEATERRKPDLRRVISHLKRVGIVRERSSERYELTRNFRERFEAELHRTGITYSEREQKRRHAEQRDRRNRDLGGAIKRSDAPLRGAAHVRQTVEVREREAEERAVEEQRQKVGTTPAVFLRDELAGVEGVRHRELDQRWRERGGRPSDLVRAVWSGPFAWWRDPATGERYVIHDRGAA